MRRDAGFFCQLAQRRGPGFFAFVDPALRHLPRIVGVIDAQAYEDLALAVQQHDADPAPVSVTLRHTCQNVSWYSSSSKPGSSLKKTSNFRSGKSCASFTSWICFIV